MSAVLAGQCRACHRDVVRIVTDGKVERTYHPWNSLPEGEVSCPVLLPIPNTDHLPEPMFSLNIPADQFIPDVVQPCDCAARPYKCMCGGRGCGCLLTNPASFWGADKQRHFVDAHPNAVQP